MLIGEWLNGRVAVSKTVGCVFESRLPCHSLPITIYCGWEAFSIQYIEMRINVATKLATKVATKLATNHLKTQIFQSPFSFYRKNF